MRFRPLTAAVILMAGLAFSSGAGARALAVEEANTLTIPEIEANLADSHPTVFYVFAKRLYQEDRRDDAVKWFYVGQIRYRFLINANPHMPGSGDPSIHAALEDVLGRTINTWAGGDPPRWAAAIDMALRWDADHPNAHTSKADHASELYRVRDAMVTMRNQILTDVEKIRQVRRDAGLENR